MSDETKSIKAAVLDERGVFLRTVEVADPADLGARMVDLRAHGGDCDLPSGKYRWDVEKQSFIPLPVERQKRTAEAPSLEEAFYAYLKEGALAPTTLEWVTWYEKTLDGQAPVTGGR